MTAKLLTLERERIDPHKLYGFVVGQSHQLMLLHNNDDFQFNGYVVVRKKDITRLNTSESNDYCAKIIRKEGLWERVPRNIKKLPLTSWGDILNCFVGKVVILQNERTDDFYIGPVLEVTSSAVIIHHFDGCGEFVYKKKVLLNRLTCMIFGDRYSMLHAKYMRVVYNHENRGTIAL